jgi:hypothetical protein
MQHTLEHHGLVFWSRLPTQCTIPTDVGFSPSSIDGLEAGGHDDSTDFEGLDPLLLIEEYRVPVAGFEAGLLALARAELDALLGIDQDDLRDGLRVRQVDRLPFGKADVELVLELAALVDAGVDALLAAHAERHVDVAWSVLDGDLVTSYETFHLDHVGHRHQRDVRVGLHLGHLRREDAGRAVERRKRLVELCHVAADRGLALDQIDVLAGVGQSEGGRDAGDPAADHQDLRPDRHAAGLQRPMVAHALHRRPNEIDRFFRRRLAVLVHPRGVLADVDHLEEERVQSPRGGCAAEGLLVEVG